MKVRRTFEFEFIRGKEAFSLVEVVVALGIFSIASIGIIRGVLWTQVAARQITIENAVNSNIEGYIAQLKAIEYSALVALVSASDGTEISTINLAPYYAGEDAAVADGGITRTEMEGLLRAPLAVNEWVDRQFVSGFDRDGDPIYSDLRIRVSLDDFNAVSIAEADRREFVMVTLEYEWNAPRGGGRVAPVSREQNFIVVANNL